MEKKIKSVEKGWGESSVFFSTNERTSPSHRVDEIKEEYKQISSDTGINIYRGYINGNLVFEMGASIDVTVVYY